MRPYNEQMRDGPTARKKNTLTRIGRARGKSKHRHGLYCVPENKGRSWCRHAKNNSKSKWDGCTPKAILMLAMGITTSRIQRETKDGKSNTLKGQNTSWLQVAQDRRTWKEHEHKFTTNAAAATKNRKNSTRVLVQQAQGKFCKLKDNIVVQRKSPRLHQRGEMHRGYAARMNMKGLSLSSASSTFSR